MENPKPKRIRDRKAIAQARQSYCGSSYSLQVHHIQSRGSGGHDIAQNLICLCYERHRKAHDGNISRRKLITIVARREKKEPEEIEGMIWEMMR